MRFLIVGFGQSGRSVARFLSTDAIEFDVFDDKGADAFPEQMRQSIASRRFCPPLDEVIAESYDEIIVSPGVPADHPVLISLNQRGMRHISEVEFAARHVRGPIIGVTGSNGKSTTVSLIHHLLSCAGKKSTLCGNIGVPFTDCIDEDPDRYFVVEISSFQLEAIDRFCPFVGVLLNVTADHLDRHQDMNGYLNAKLRLFENQRGDQWAVFPHSLTARIPGRGTQVAVPHAKALLADGVLWVDRDYPVCLDTFRLLGDHNLSNLLFSCVVAKVCGVVATDVRDYLSSFQGLEHRLEVVGRLEDRTWINDSKATNIASTQVAVTAMNGPYVLILGGSDKGADFSELDLTGHRPSAIVAYGDTSSQIQADLSAYAPQIVLDFEAACRTAHRLGSPGSTILMSPACASFDQFANFMERGRAFKSLFNRMKGEVNP